MSMFMRVCMLGIAVALMVACSALDRVMSPFGSAAEPVSLIGDPVRGETLFRVGAGNAPPCSTCHHVGQGTIGMSLGPNLKGIASKVGERETSLTPEEYIIESILDPQRYEVSGFRVSMYEYYADYLTPQDLADIVAYLIAN